MNRVVAVTARLTTIEGRARLVLNDAYLAAVRRAGLVPLVVPATLDPAEGAAALARVSGLVLTGGEDVAPGLYGAPPHPKLEETDPVRDALEVALIGAASERGIPVLGICRGLQILNVALGGTLYQDLPSERPGPIDHADTAQHALRIAAASSMRTALGVAETTVNSRHHQAIRDLAPRLRASAWAPDGVIEAVEGTEATWTMAVQWHPEDEGEGALFRTFAAAVN
ncbi:MAG TPA: gamma-glutamyl-gamma-aminobutyrate hydrolase family protein [Gemmatimonadales bacterium]|nr:gamma-glutamyl-gamma-aminobutyrate hydrolase family protein [Gemmatimonadales bacterium]